MWGQQSLLAAACSGCCLDHLGAPFTHLHRASPKLDGGDTLRQSICGDPAAWAASKLRIVML